MVPSAWWFRALILTISSLVAAQDATSTSLTSTSSASVCYSTCAATPLTDPSFENGSSAWKYSTGASLVTNDAANAYDGSSYVSLNGISDGSYYSVYQTMPSICPGALYAVTGHIKILAAPDSSTGVSCIMDLRIDGQYMASASLTSTGGWVSFTGSRPIYAYSATLNIAIVCSGNSASNYPVQVLVDDISLTLQSARPTTACIAPTPATWYTVAKSSSTTTSTSIVISTTATTTKTTETTTSSAVSTSSTSAAGTYIVSVSTGGSKKKRQSGVFLTSSGSSSSDCAAGLAWTLTNGQMYSSEGGYISTESGTANGLLKPYMPAKAISTTFALVNNYLVWSDESFANHQAIFCSSTEGLVGVYDGNVPNDCSVVQVGLFAGKQYLKHQSHSSKRYAFIVKRRTDRF